MKRLFTAILVAFAVAFAAPQAVKAADGSVSADQAPAPAAATGYSTMAPAAGGGDSAVKATDNAMSKDTAETAKPDKKAKKHHKKSSGNGHKGKKHHKKADDKKADDAAAGK